MGAFNMFRKSIKENNLEAGGEGSPHLITASLEANNIRNIDINAITGNPERKRTMIINNGSTEPELEI